MKIVDRIYDLMSSFKDVTLLLKDVLVQELERFHITPAQLFIMQYIANADDARMTDVATYAHMSVGAASVHVEKLVQKGFVDRSHSINDRRRIVLGLTEAGHNMVETAYGTDSSLMKRMSALITLPPGDVDHLLRIHQTILNNGTRRNHFA